MFLIKPIHENLHGDLLSLIYRRPGTSFTLEGPGSIVRTAGDKVVVVLSGILCVFEVLQEIEAVV